MGHFSVRPSLRHNLSNLALLAVALVGCWLFTAPLSVEAFISPSCTTSRRGPLAKSSASAVFPQCLYPRRKHPQNHLHRPPTRLHTTTGSSSSAIQQPSDDAAASAANTNTKEASSKVNYNWTPSTLQIALPALVAMLADPLLSLVDTLYTGRVGSTELAALGACTSIFHLAFNAFRGFTAATTSLVATELSKAKSGDDDGTVQQVTAISLTFAAAVGCGVTVLLYLMGERALAAIGVPSSSLQFGPAREYLYTRLWAAPAVLFIGVAEGAFRGYANTVVPLVASGCASALNLVLDPLLMFGRIGWGVKGAAAATAVSQLGAAIVYAYKLVSHKMIPPIQLARRRNKKSQ